MTKNLRIGTIAAVISLLCLSLLYILFHLPSLSTPMQESIDQETFYKIGSVTAVWDEECAMAISDAPVQADIPDKTTCVIAKVLIQGYGQHDVQAPYGTSTSDLQPGTRVVMANYDNGTTNTWFMSGIDKSKPVIIAFAFCIALILMVTGAKGFKALIGIGLSLCAIMFYLIPAILSGHPTALVTLAVSVLILGVVMYLTHGISWMTTSAFLGTAGGLGIIIILWAVFDLVAKSYTVQNNEIFELMTFLPQDPLVLSSLGNIYSAGIILTAIGILNDVMIAQASTVWALQRSSGQTLTTGQAFKEAMKVGKDHISSAMYTLVFVYTATALPMMLSSYVYMNLNLTALLSSEFGLEILRTGICITGLMLATPLTTYLAGFMSTYVPRKALEQVGHSHEHSEQSDDSSEKEQSE